MVFGIHMHRGLDPCLNILIINGKQTGDGGEDEQLLSAASDKMRHSDVIKWLPDKSTSHELSGISSFHRQKSGLLHRDHQRNLSGNTVTAFSLPVYNFRLSRNN